MNINLLKPCIQKTWDTSILTALKEYITIPALSPAFNPQWEKDGHLADTLTLAATWIESMQIKDTCVEIIQPKGKTPVLLVEIAATDPDDSSNILMYGHLDKQPEASGWDKNKGPWTPVIENNRLYGRGAADDGYAVFASITAVKALQEQKIPHPRCMILIETCEESGSRDLEYYLETRKETIRTPDLIICLDSGCADYERMWVTTSLRGMISGQLKARILKSGIHSGASGAVASSFRILRQILDRIEDAKTGNMLIEEFHTPIPDNRLKQMKSTAATIGTQILDKLPLYKGTTAVSEDPLELIVNHTWKPAISYTGMAGIPSIETAGNVLRESTTLLLSIRTPPTLDTALPAENLKKIIEQEPPYNAAVSFSKIDHSMGWHMPDMDADMKKAIEKTADTCFGFPLCYTGEGGSIPFMTLLADRFPNAKFLITGVLGPDSNPHGPNEFLHLDYVKKLTLAVSSILGQI